MRLIIMTFLLFAMPISGLGWAEGSNILLDPNLMCKKSRRVRGKLAEICHHESSLLKEIISGINLGFRECEFQFRNRRWNCTLLRRSMRKILMRDTRETSYLNAITSAGVTYTISKACALGNLVECSCDKSHLNRIGMNIQNINSNTEIFEQYKKFNKKNVSVKLHNTPQKPNIERGRQILKQRKLIKNMKIPSGEWEWGGCSDNINFGFLNSRVFLDAKYRKRRDLRALVKLHNNKAGRLAIRDSMRMECKCHGLSGSCTIKTCWLKMAPFREVGGHIFNKFNNAYKVTLRNDGNSFMPEANTTKQPGKYDLVYADDSFDFCLPSPKSGSLGTTGRQCNASANVDGSCEILCCGRGYKLRMESELVNCNCIFKWCCEVTCEKCLERRELNLCL